MSLLWPVVQYALCLTLRTYDAARIVHFDPRRYPHYAFDVMGEFLRRGGAGCRIGRLVGTLHVNAQVVHSAGTGEFNLKVGSEPSALKDLLLDLGREDVDPSRCPATVG